jgi:hypothetical protein
MKTVLSTVALLVMLMVFTQHGCPKWTAWKTQDIIETARAEKAADDIKNVARPATNKTIIVGTKYSQDLLKELQFGETLEFTPTASPGVHMLALINESIEIEWSTLNPTNHWSGATMRIKVDPQHHPTGTSATVDYKIIR